MARLPNPRNAEGNSPRVTGTPLPRNSISQSIPPAPGYFAPFIPTAGDTAGDTVYFLLNSIFDPRTMQTTAGTNVYSIATPGQDYRSIWIDLIYQVVFGHFRMRQDPTLSTLVDMLDVIVDTTRCLGIYLTALAMSQSRDPDMFARARVLNVYDAKTEMQSMLASLPLPRYLVELSLKYIGLVDVSGSYNFQNVGYLCTGDYSDFTTLYANIMSKPLARNFLREIYPEIGLLGDPSGSQNTADMLQMFVNSSFKSVSSGFVPYILADGASDESLRIQSGGVLHATERGSAIHTVTGWAAPGSGIGNSSVRVFWPSMCVWKPSTGKDAAITRTLASQVFSSAAGIVSFETQQNAALAVNMVHEYNMNKSDTSPMDVTTVLNGNTGQVSTSEPLALENARYRVSAGFQLGALTYDLQANVVSLFRDILLP